MKASLSSVPEMSVGIMAITSSKMETTGFGLVAGLLAIAIVMGKRVLHMVPMLEV